MAQILVLIYAVAIRTGQCWGQCLITRSHQLIEVVIGCSKETHLGCSLSQANHISVGCFMRVSANEKY